METKTIKITGMTCGNCEKSVKNAIMEVDGVSDAIVSASTGNAVVTFDNSKVSEEQIKKAVNDTEIYVAE